jgi:uracil-DNA glycosylase family 4
MKASETPEQAWEKLQRQIVRCHLCPRLRAYCARVARTKRKAYLDWDYWGRPVPNFGTPPAGLLIVGLAPAAHGANRTGRMFTGDRSGDWLYRALHKAGFASQPTATSRDDGLVLFDCVVTAVCHCAPPSNRPLPDELEHCRRWLSATIDLVRPQVLLALGQIAWKAVLDQARQRGWHVGGGVPFRHGLLLPLGEGRWAIASYHPSQQNTFTGKLTEAMLDDVVRQAKTLLQT